jgi:hypothetical protein
VRLDNQDVPYSMLFSRVRVKNIRYDPNATFLFRYSFYNPEQYPYSAIGPDNTQVSYQFKDGNVQFTISAIQANSYYRIMSYKYTLFAARSAKDLKEAVQCGIIAVL